MMGPTYFAETLKRFQQIIEVERAGNDKLYFIFVILTDGCIHDMKETCKEIVKMSYMPVSLVIVGIGDEDFDDMETLDADTQVLQADDGRYAARDIIQFVPLDDIKEMAYVEVAERVLSEIPHHFVDYMVLQQIEPDTVKRRKESSGGAEDDNEAVGLLDPADDEKNLKGKTLNLHTIHEEE
jgi:copine 5/8/9